MDPIDSYELQVDTFFQWTPGFQWTPMDSNELQSYNIQNEFQDSDTAPVPGIPREIQAIPNPVPWLRNSAYFSYSNLKQCQG